MLPARLRASHNGNNLTYLTDLLNATGKQTVANLQMSVVQPWKEVVKDARARREAAGWDEDDYGDSKNNDSGDLQLPIDFAPKDESAVVSDRAGRLHRKKPRMFGQAVVCRDGEQKEEDFANDEDEETGLDRRAMMQRRFALKPVSQRYKVDLGFPLLDSFPYIYQQTTNSTASIPVTTALATDRAVADRLQSLRTTVTVGAAWAIGIEDREALSNDLAGMADAYHDGWSSGSDNGDDEE